MGLLLFFGRSKYIGMRLTQIGTETDCRDSLIEAMAIKIFKEKAVRDFDLRYITNKAK